MKKFRFVVAALATASMVGASLFLAAPISAHGIAHHVTAKKVITVGLVTDKGGLNDKSFNHLADVGLTRAEKQLKIKGAVLQSHTAGDYQPNLTKFAQQKKSLIIAVGFLMENALYNVAKQYPKEHFAIVDGAPANSKGQNVNLPNVANLFFKPEQSGYLVGVIAGLLEKNHKGPPGKDHNTVASIAGANFLAVTAYNCGYQEGVWSVDPKAKVLIAFDDGTFQNTANAKAIGQKQISQGADILFQVDGGAGLGYLQAAEEAHKYGIGVDADQDYLSPWIITSALKKVDQAVYVTIKRLVSGGFHAGNNIFDLKNKATGYATDTHHVPASIKSKVKKIAKEIKSGKIKVKATCTLGKKK
ncbi:MAG TPA: BMP family ABC transporter substrate-binding protein [Chloroflexota bacterium]|nr:BMP family ABC transporter substrate-binding protein [Chloroflexota bacterium]